MNKMVIATVVVATVGIASLASAQWGNNPWGKNSNPEPHQESRPLRAAAGIRVLSLAEGQRLVLRDGGYLTSRSGQLTLVSQAGLAKVFPQGSRLTQDSRGQVGIWGTGGTTIVGTSNVDLGGAPIDSALPRAVNEKDKSIVDPSSAQHP